MTLLAKGCLLEIVYELEAATGAVSKQPPQLQKRPRDRLLRGEEPFAKASRMT